MSDSQNPGSQEIYSLVGKLISDIKLCKYSYQTGKSCIYIVRKFLESGLSEKEFLLGQSGKSTSAMRLDYFALKFFNERVLEKGFAEGRQDVDPSSCLLFLVRKKS